MGLMIRTHSLAAIQRHMATADILLLDPPKRNPIADEIDAFRNWIPQSKVEEESDATASAIGFVMRWQSQLSDESEKANLGKLTSELIRRYLDEEEIRVKIPTLEALTQYTSGQTGLVKEHEQLAKLLKELSGN